MGLGYAHLSRLIILWIKVPGLHSAAGQGHDLGHERLVRNAAPALPIRPHLPNSTDLRGTLALRLAFANPPAAQR